MDNQKQTLLLIGPIHEVRSKRDFMNTVPDVLQRCPNQPTLIVTYFQTNEVLLNGLLRQGDNGVMVFCQIFQAHPILRQLVLSRIN